MKLTDYLAAREPIAPRDADSWASEFGERMDAEVYPRSITAAKGSLLFLARRGDTKYLVSISGNEGGGAGNFAGAAESAPWDEGGAQAILFHTSAENAAVLCSVLPFLAARPLDLAKSAGFGDRLGLATPGHVRAARGSTMAPIFAQQSMRENARTGRTPQQVMDDALWGAFQEGWRDGFGADADHLKTIADVDLCVAAGYSFYTVDPGEFVDNEAGACPPADLERKLAALPWATLESSVSDLRRLAAKPVDLGTMTANVTEEEWLRAAAKYGKAVAHTVMMYRHLNERMGEKPFDFEMSVDETETPSTLAEHLYIAQELKRLRVRCVSLAPRYVGTFEKGVDYIGDLKEFERSFAGHLAVSRAFGPYKLSLHSGSDKFSVYPIAARLAGNLVHLKTAGTSYLEALRAVAVMNPSLFREIVPFAAARYATDRASYHVSADPARMPPIQALPDGKLGLLLDDFHAREVLHVTFGSVINDARFREPFFATLRDEEETYYQVLERHFRRHLTPFGTANERRHD
jgi:tagaturonate epimerase